MRYQLKTRQICLFFIAFLPVTKFFMLPSVIAQTSNEDMWISALLSVLIDALTLFILLRCCKKYNLTYYELLQNNFGKITAKAIFAIYFLYFLSKSLLPIIEQREYLMHTLYTTMPNIFYFLPFFVALFYISTKKLRVLGRVSDLLWPLTSLGYLILLVLSFYNVDLSAILPTFARGTKILEGSYYSLNWFGDAVYLLFFMGEFKYTKGTTYKVLISFLISGLMVVVFMIVFYCTFMSISFRQQFALTEISKYTTVINSTGRLDYLAIVLLLFSNVFSLIMPAFFATRALNKVFEFKKDFISPLIVTALIAIPVLGFGEFNSTIQHVLVNYFGIFFFVMGNILPILTVFIKKRRKENAQAKN